MDVAVVVGQGSLTGMAKESRIAQKRPNPPAIDGRHAECQSEVDAQEPDLAACSVEKSPDGRALVGHACQLAVGTVVPVGPYQQQHADGVHLQTVEVKEVTATSTDDDGQQCHGDGVDVQRAEEQSPKVARGTRHIQFEGTFRVLRFHGCLHFFPETHTLNIVFGCKGSVKNDAVKVFFVLKTVYPDTGNL